jgi:hypothetical protein
MNADALDLYGYLRVLRVLYSLSSQVALSDIQYKRCAIARGAQRRMNRVSTLSVYALTMWWRVKEEQPTIVVC